MTGLSTPTWQSQDASLHRQHGHEEATPSGLDAILVSLGSRSDRWLFRVLRLRLGRLQCHFYFPVMLQRQQRQHSSGCQAQHHRHDTILLCELVR